MLAVFVLFRETMESSTTYPNESSVGLIFGGRSGEHEISLRSANSVKLALDPNRYVVRDLFIDKYGRWHPAPLVPEPGGNPGIDVVFPNAP